MAVTLRDDQIGPYDHILSNRYAVLSAPTGWGKTLVLVAAAATQLGASGSRKAIVVIPQNLVAGGFIRSATLDLPSGPADWRVKWNLCARTQGKTGRLGEFITSPAGEDRVVVTTHMSLCMVMGTLPDEDVAAGFRDTTVICDEAHHIRSGDESNLLGGAINRIMSLAGTTCSIVLATAGMFRGDRLRILTDEQEARFRKYHVRFDEHWARLKHLKHYRYDYVAFRGTPWADLEKVLAASQEPTIIYCPPAGHQLHGGREKMTTVQRITELVRRHYPNAEMWRAGTRSKQVILDLADITDRSAKVAFVQQHPDSVAVILTVGMFREGADWPRAARAIDLIPSGSDQDRLQRFGRLIRDYPGKSQISYLSFVPRITTGTQEDQRRRLTRWYAHLNATLILANMISPVRVPVPTSDGHGGVVERPVDLLSQYSLQQQEVLLRACCDALIALADERAKTGLEVGAAEAERTLTDVLRDEFNVSEPKPLARQVVAILRRGNKATSDVDHLVKAGFDKVSAVTDGLLVFSAGVGGPSTLAEVRRAIDSTYEAAWNDAFAAVSSLAAPPRSDTDLYNWITHQKVLHQQGTLDPERERKLASIGWWTWQTGFRDRWQEMYDQVAALSTCPKAQTPEYNWVRQQRRQHEAKTLLAERVAACERIRWWTWGGNEDNWEATFNHLSSLTEMPRSAKGTYVEDYEKVKYLRKRHAQGKLPAERVRQLESIGWWTWA